jgi:hypothetical protein
MNYQFILSQDFDIVKFKNKISIIYIENVDKYFDQLCLDEEYFDELEEYYSDYDYPYD